MPQSAQGLACRLAGLQLSCCVEPRLLVWNLLRPWRKSPISYARILQVRYGDDSFGNYNLPRDFIGLIGNFSDRDKFLR